ncbi:MAG: hypothetical protein M0R80_29285 [Proteobacteria bacterium]|jgi:hypothetical protein|nr:hypothetical protein [Pseudomonadota bacterium]
MSQLASTIEKAAHAFAQSILAAVKEASLQELLALQGELPKRGRPAKVAKPLGRKPGRPPKASAKKTAKKIKWPTCKRKGCTKNAWARGKGFCGEHAKKK